MSGELLELTLAADPEAPGLARAAVERLGGRLPTDVLDRTRLLVSELVSASLRQTSRHRDIVLTIRIERSRIHVEVTGAAQWLAGRSLERALPGAFDWSLYLVAQLADRWGAEKASRTAWFDIDIEA